MKKIKLSRILPFYVAVACTMVLAVIMVLQAQINDIYERNLPLMAISDNVKNKVTKGHLWFEEYMAGDQSINPERDVIKALFEKSQTILQTALSGGECEIGHIQKVEDLTMEHLIRSGDSKIEELISITRIRKESADSSATHQNQASANAGSDLDGRFDEQYKDVQETMEQLSVFINAKVKEDTRKVKTLGLISLAVIVLIFILIGFFVFKIQDKNEKNEQAQIQRMLKDEDYIKQMTAFADSIGQGNYDMDLSSSNDDILSMSLNTMRIKLKKVSEEDRKQNWVNAGLSQMSNLLRQNVENEDALYSNFLNSFVKYIRANQSALFLIREPEHEAPFLEAVACVAYEKNKYYSQRLNIHDGLIGQSILEKDMLYLTEIPSNYIKITSGLGDALPTNLVIVPLVYNEKVYGVMEIASFFVLEQYECDFIAKVAEHLAATVGMINTNTRTRHLLESVQQQAEEMRAQEEEMRQNLEELRSTQEEMLRKEKHYLRQIEEYKTNTDQASSYHSVA